MPLSVLILHIYIHTNLIDRLEELKRLETKEIDISEIKETVFERSVVDNNEITSLSQSIIANGQQQPIKVSPIEGGGYRLVYGSQRVEAMKFAKIPTIRAEITDKPLSDSQAMILSAIENGQRQNLNPYDNARQIQRLVELGIKKGEIALLYRRANSWVSDTLKVLDMPNDVVQSVKKGEIGIAQIRELHQIPDKKKLEILPKIKNSTVRKTVKEITENEKMSKLEIDIQKATENLRYYNEKLKESKEAEEERDKVKSQIELIKKQSKQVIKRLKLADKKGELNKLLTSIAKLDRDYYPLLKGITMLDEKKTALNTEISELTYDNDEFKKLEKENFELIKKKTGLTEQLLEINNSLVRNKAKYEKIKKVVNELEGKQKEIEKLDKILEKHRTKTSEIEKSYKTVIKNIDSNRNSAKKFKSELQENENLASQLVTLTKQEGQLRGIANNRKAHAEKIEKLTVELKGLNAEISKK